MGTAKEEALAQVIVPERKGAHLGSCICQPVLQKLIVSNLVNLQMAQKLLAVYHLLQTGFK